MIRTAAPATPGEVASASGITKTDRVAIQDLLDRRAQAVMDRDRKAFMGDLAELSRDFARRQRHLWRWLSDVPFDSYRLKARWDRSGDLIRPSDVARYPDPQAATIPSIEERYRIAGFDNGDAVENLYYTFVKFDDRWLIAEDTDLDDLTLFSARHLWDFGPVYTIRSGHFLVMGHPCGARGGCAPIPEDLLSLAEQGVARVDSLWPGRWPHHIVVLAPDNVGELRRMLQLTFDPEDFVAFAYSTVDARHGIDYTGHRVVLNPHSLDDRSAGSILHILAHELLHIATRTTSGPFVPTFVEEGLAEYVGTAGDPATLAFFNSQVAAGNFDGLIPEDFQFTIGSGTDIYGSYQKAQSTVSYFISRWGIDGFFRFYRRLGAQDIEPGTARYQIDRAMRSTIGLSFKRFQQEWAGSIGVP